MKVCTQRSTTPTAPRLYDKYIINKGFELFGKLSQDELEEYYDLDYLDKICSSKTEGGGETPMFWVI